MKRWMWLAGLLSVSVGCEIEEIGGGNGLIDVKNEDSAPVKVLITDNESCVVGLHSAVQPEGIRQFDINEEGSYLCINEDPPAYRVENGKSYQITGGKLLPR